MLLLVVATTSWRRGVYFEGGVDPVVAGKAALSILALSMAWLARQAQRDPQPVGGRTFWMLTAYLTVATFGGLAAGHVVPAAVLSIRMFILGLTLILLVRTFPVERLFRDLLTAMLVVGGVAATTGLGSILEQGRLFGGIPPSHPNEIAMLLGIPLIGLVWLAVQGRASTPQLVIALTCFALIWATGSRTGLLAVVVALAVMLLQARRLGPAAASVVAAIIPLAVYGIFASEAVAQYLGRGGAANLTTLSSRTIAWQAAWSYPETQWARWMGSGLNQKLIPVKGQWWDTQLLDSTWVSALVQAGFLGVIILMLWLVGTIVASLHCAWRARMFFVAVLSYLVIRSIVESGLLDSTAPFLVLMLVSLTSDRVTRRGWRPASNVEPPEIRPVIPLSAPPR
ncbi:O-antigen ligase family protein [Ornithinimicrobium sufpigmenti]|uniref:O-antigen ligase family protein n=1 Tax=Ornithinimicrobium sufpigmenti TaxID=2508882 RepID=UPI0010359530|nr:MULTISPECIES: O-antigen ligase family protein [unclassified Ornithinimicrobium]